jgi:hypothetical protein
MPNRTEPELPPTLPREIRLRVPIVTDRARPAQPPRLAPGASRAGKLGGAKRPLQRAKLGPRAKRVAA